MALWWRDSKIPKTIWSGDKTSIWCLLRLSSYFCCDIHPSGCKNLFLKQLMCASMMKHDGFAPKFCGCRIHCPHPLKATELTELTEYCGCSCTNCTPTPILLALLVYWSIPTWAHDTLVYLLCMYIYESCIRGYTWYPIHAVAHLTMDAGAGVAVGATCPTTWKLWGRRPSKFGLSMSFIFIFVCFCTWTWVCPKNSGPNPGSF